MIILRLAALFDRDRAHAQRQHASLLDDVALAMMGWLRLIVSIARQLI
jgi:hypothetical protein